MMNPHIINLLIKGHQEKVKEQDYLMWLMGKYIERAVGVAVEHCLVGRKAKSQYYDEPLLVSIEEKKRSENELTEEEKQKAVDLFFAREKVRRANWKRAHKKDKV